MRELANHLSQPPSTVHRLLNQLAQQGLIETVPESGQYRIGLELYRMMLLAQSKFVLRNAAMPFMRALVSECNETSFLGVYDPSRLEMMFAAAVDCSKPVRYVVPLNEWIPVYCAASGLAIMAFLPNEERQSIIEHTGLQPLTEHSITDPDLLHEEMARIRMQGYACSHGQRVPGAVGIAAPIWGPAGRVVGDLNLTIPEQRFEPSLETKLAGRVMHYAESITRHLVSQSSVHSTP